MHPYLTSCTVQVVILLTCHVIRKYYCCAYCYCCICVCFRESEGHSPLVRARLRGHHNVVKLLLKRGAKVEPQDLRAAIEEGNE